MWDWNHFFVTLGFIFMEIRGCNWELRRSWERLRKTLTTSNASPTCRKKLLHVDNLCAADDRADKRRVNGTVYQTELNVVRACVAECLLKMR